MSGAQSTTYLFVGRIIAGIAVGQFSHVVPLYLAEISPAEIRGALVSVQQLGICKSTLERSLRLLSDKSYKVVVLCSHTGSATEPPSSEDKPALLVDLQLLDGIHIQMYQSVAARVKRPWRGAFL